MNAAGACSKLIAGGAVWLLMQLLLGSLQRLAEA